MTAAPFTFTEGTWVRVAAPVADDLADKLHPGALGMVCYSGGEGEKRFHFVLFPLTRQMEALHEHELQALAVVSA